MAKKKRAQPEKKSNRTLIYAGLAVLLVAVLAVYALNSSTPNKPQEKLPTAGYIKLNQPTTYEPGKVKITEFMKFDCSHCYDLHKDTPQLLEKYKENVTVTYVPIVWPGQSTKSIEAYILAEQMGKGEEMLNALFNTQFVNGTNVMESVPTLEGIAANIGLGADFNAKLEGGGAREAALANLELMNKYSVQGTPTIIINGNLQVDPPTATNLDAVISSLLN